MPFISISRKREHSGLQRRRTAGLKLLGWSCWAQLQSHVVRQLVEEHRVSLVSIQETKLDFCDHTIIRDMLGSDFDFFDLLASHTCGGDRACLESLFLVGL